MKAPPFRYHAPEDLASAVALLAQHENARVLAGGQSLMPMMNLRVAGPDHLVDLGRIADLRGMEETPQGLRIGAMTTQRALSSISSTSITCTISKTMPGLKAFRLEGRLSVTQAILFSTSTSFTPFL